MQYHNITHQAIHFSFIFLTLNDDSDVSHLFGVTLNSASVSDNLPHWDKKTVNLKKYEHDMVPVDENCNEKPIIDLTRSSDTESDVEDENLANSSDETVANFPNPIARKLTASEDAGGNKVSIGRGRRRPGR